MKNAFSSKPIRQKCWQTLLSSSEETLQQKQPLNVSRPVPLAKPIRQKCWQTLLSSSEETLEQKQPLNVIRPVPLAKKAVHVHAPCNISDFKEGGGTSFSACCMNASYSPPSISLPSSCMTTKSWPPCPSSCSICGDKNLEMLVTWTIILLSEVQMSSPREKMHPINAVTQGTCPSEECS